MVTPKFPPSHSPPKNYALLLVKILFILLILFLLPELVESKSGNKKDRRLKKKYMSIVHDCEVDFDKCGNLILEESMSCVSKCASPSCFEEIYASNPLEDGEVDDYRNRLFEKCAKREMRTLAQQAKQSRK
mmetsp:Transcript_14110/g.18818  ORF Transcript_14110/g.18818 Transcript_14110/m.18818 type:complete len:131 (-) Transcript_14110:309-701(-)